MAKILCPGTHTQAVEAREYHGGLLIQCGRCKRVLKGGTVDPMLLRQHSVPGKKTRSHDTTMGHLWVMNDGR